MAEGDGNKQTGRAAAHAALAQQTHAAIEVDRCGPSMVQTETGVV